MSAPCGLQVEQDHYKCMVERTSTIRSWPVIPRIMRSAPITKMISPWNLANRVVRSIPIGDVLAFDFQSSLEYFLKNKNHIPVPARTIPRMSERVWLFIIIDMTINALHCCYLMRLHTTTKLIRATGTALSVVGKRLRLLNRNCYYLMRASFPGKFD